jgi:hypothetical protein
MPDIVPWVQKSGLSAVGIAAYFPGYNCGFSAQTTSPHSPNGRRRAFIGLARFLRNEGDGGLWIAAFGFDRGKHFSGAAADDKNIPRCRHFVPGKKTTPRNSCPPAQFSSASRFVSSLDHIVPGQNGIKLTNARMPPYVFVAYGRSK